MTEWLEIGFKLVVLVVAIGAIAGVLTWHLSKRLGLR